MWTEALSKSSSSVDRAWAIRAKSLCCRRNTPPAHLPDSKARCSTYRSTYWGRGDDLDIEYSIILQQNANLMLAHCLRRWLNINPTLAHVTSRVWWDVVGAVCDTSCEILGHLTCVVWCRAGVVDSGPALKQHSCYDLGSSEPCVGRCTSLALP